MVALGGGLGSAAAQPVAEGEHPDIRLFLEAASLDGQRADYALSQIGEQWRNAYAGIMWDLAWLVRPPGQGFQRFFTLIGFLEQQTGQKFGPDLARWREWIWNQPYDPHPDYAYLKGQWYAQIDPRFEEFFSSGVTSLIRLDEIDWGGVGVNGIPPLEYPRSLESSEADYLADEHVVFGIAVNGQFRAYPKRILAWHEMVLDQIGGVELTIVYCTLCGTVIPFESVASGKHLTFGTSGLLYRSNKLMFDQETRSLWNTFKGIPVVGTLAGSGVRLVAHGVVTTTWGEWRTKHPTTTVLDVETGYRRDYREGIAYRDYFSNDQLMFQVSAIDDRLPNKKEVVAVRLANSSKPSGWAELAITAAFLDRNRVFHCRLSGKNLVVVTSDHGANRVYDARGIRFEGSVNDRLLTDDEGRKWQITESALILDEVPSERRNRVPAQRAFWFGWYAQFPDTDLID